MLFWRTEFIQVSGLHLRQFTTAGLIAPQIWRCHSVWIFHLRLRSTQCFCQPIYFMLLAIHHIEISLSHELPSNERAADNRRSRVVLGCFGFMAMVSGLSAAVSELCRSAASLHQGHDHEVR